MPAESNAQEMLDQIGCVESHGWVMDREGWWWHATKAGGGPLRLADAYALEKDSRITPLPQRPA
jgi:hypothetical protein